MPTIQFVESITESVQYAAEGTFSVAERMQASKEEALMHEHALILRLHVSKEEGRMMDRAIGEYDDWCMPSDMLQRGAQVTCSTPCNHSVNITYAACLSTGCVHDRTAPIYEPV